MEMRTPSSRSCMQRRQRRLVVVQQHRFGDLQLEPVAPAGPNSASACTMAGTRLRDLELHRRQVDRDLDALRPAAASRQACRSTHSPIGTISPVSSASGMKSAGGTIPRSGWCQRSSASKPPISPLSRSTIGW